MIQAKLSGCCKLLFLFHDPMKELFDQEKKQTKKQKQKKKTKSDLATFGPMELSGYEKFQKKAMELFW